LEIDQGMGYFCNSGANPGIANCKLNINQLSLVFLEKKQQQQTLIIVI
jgi:hypothetical protein